MRAILRGRSVRRQGQPPAPRPPDRTHPRRRLQRAAFAALYGPAALRYDRFTRWLFLGEWEEWQACVASFLPDRGPILELGCGTGVLAARLAGDGRHWIALDRSSAMIRVARARRQPVLSLLRGDARNLPIASGSVACVVATFPAPFILAGETHAEIARVLAPDGHLVVVWSARLAPDGLARRWRVALLDRFYGTSRSEGYADVPDLRITGLSGAWRTVATPHGEALLYVATREGMATP